MSYLIIGLITLALLTAISGGWYFLFKRFEQRMSERFDDLVQRSEETLKSFSDIIELLGQFKEFAEQGRDEVMQKLVDIGHDEQRLLDGLKLATEELKLHQGLLLSIKHTQFLEVLESEMSELQSAGDISPESLKEFAEKLQRWRAENFAKY